MQRTERPLRLVCLRVRIMPRMLRLDDHWWMLHEDTRWLMVLRMCVSVMLAPMSMGRWGRYGRPYGQMRWPSELDRSWGEHWCRCTQHEPMLLLRQSLWRTRALDLRCSRAVDTEQRATRQARARTHLEYDFIVAVRVIARIALVLVHVSDYCIDGPESLVPARVKQTARAACWSAEHDPTCGTDGTALLADRVGQPYAVMLLVRLHVSNQPIINLGDM